MGIVGGCSVPIAVSADGLPVELDIKDSAQGGTGPHGMLVGATGSGKSERLHTLVLAFALTNSSETLNFTLVNYKGGATFLGLDQMPHMSVVITNLADESALVSRVKDALHDELMRRQELLRRAGNNTSAQEYEKPTEPNWNPCRVCSPSSTSSANSSSRTGSSQNSSP